MLIVRLVHLKDMPSYEKVLDSLKKNNLKQMEENNNKIIEPENNKKIINDENQITTISKDQIKNTTQTKPVLSSLKPKNLVTKATMEKVLSFEDLIYLSSRKKEIQLKYDLEKNVNLIKFSQGKIDISFNQNLDKNFVRNLSEKLLEWTGNRWVITLSKEKGQETFSKLQDIKKKEFLHQEKKGEVYKKFKNIFSDGELLEIIKND